MKLLRSYLFFASLMLKCFAFDYYIYCDSCMNDSTTSNSCSFEKMNRVSYASPTAITAPKANRIEGNWYTYEHSSNEWKIALNITWHQSGANFGNLVDGYFLTISPQSGGPTGRLFRMHLPNGVQPGVNDMVIINYPCYGRSYNNELVDPEDSFTLKLNSLPTYLRGTDNNDNEITGHINVPGCGCSRQFPSLAQVQGCINNSYYSGYDCSYGSGRSTVLVGDDVDFYGDNYGEEDISELDYTPTTISSLTEALGQQIPIESIAIAVGGIIFLVVASTLVFCFWIKKRKSDEYILGSTKQIVVLVSRTGDGEANDLYLDIADLLIGSMEQCTDFTVHSNVRETSFEPISWTAEKLKSCGQVILVLSPLGKQNYELRNEKDPFSIAMNKLVEERKRKFLRLPSLHKFCVIYFDRNVKACVPDSISSKKVKMFQLPKNFGLFYNHIAGIKLQDVPNQHIKNLKDKIDSLSSVIV